MHFIPFCIFTIFCCYSLVNSAPVNQNSDTQETKQQKATAIAGRILKEIAGEKQIDIKQPEANHEKADVIVNHPAPQTVESEDDAKKESDAEDDSNDAEVDFPTISDLYRYYNELESRVPAETEESSESNDEDFVLPLSQEQFIQEELNRYFEEKANHDDEHRPHSPVMDDSMMGADNHRRRRRSLI